MDNNAQVQLLATPKQNSIMTNTHAIDWKLGVLLEPFVKRNGCSIRYVYNKMYINTCTQEADIDYSKWLFIH